LIFATSLPTKSEHVFCIFSMSDTRSLRLYE
jgi:hypothetical protein